MGRAAWARIIPFAVFMGFIGVEQGCRWLISHQLVRLSETDLLYLYPCKALCVGVLLFRFRRDYSELNPVDLKKLSHTIASVALGLLVFALWIHMDWNFGQVVPETGFNPDRVDQQLLKNVLILFRLCGAALVVPVMEELFWRSFLLRYIIKPDFIQVPLGTFTWASFLIGAVLFGLEHHLIFAGVMAGMAYSLLLYWTKSLYQCIVAHAVTNLALGIYVLSTQAWQFW